MCYKMKEHEEGSYMRYVIAPLGAANWRLPAARFAAKLRTEWPEAAIRIVDIVDNAESPHALEWTLPMRATRKVAGALDRTGQVVELEGDVRDCATFARWLRTQLPDTYRVQLSDEAATTTIEVRPETTEAELVGAFVL